MSDQPWENRGPCNCDKCGVAAFASELTDTCNSGDLLCAGCEESAQIAQAERAGEDASADYHGGTAPDYVYEAMAQRGGR